MTKMMNAQFSGDAEGCPRIALSEYVALEPNGDGESISVRFARKEPVNCENLVYFCGGYIDPRTRNYYASRYRMDAVFPLLRLDEVMPADSPVSVEDVVKMIAAFSPEDENAFREAWPNPFSASFVAEQDCLGVVAAVVDAIAFSRMKLNKLHTALNSFADVSPMPVHVRPNYFLFLEHLGEAEEAFKTFMLHWTVLEVLGIYPGAVNKKLTAVFNFPLFEKVHGRLNYADRAALAHLFERQRDGSLEDEASLLDDEII